METSVYARPERKYDSSERQMLQVGKAAQRTGSFSRLVPLPPWGYWIRCTFVMYFQWDSYHFKLFNARCSTWGNPKTALAPLYA
ncbi:MAG: hypothetical protein HC862_30280 [Scytonema sp. RU_4_4]|nr:hypothetical protein [Scytonema sp. RU_4_4]